VTPGVGLDAVAKKKINPCLCQESNAGRPSRSFVTILTELRRLPTLKCEHIYCNSLAEPDIQGGLFRVLIHLLCGTLDMKTLHKCYTVITRSSDPRLWAEYEAEFGTEVGKLLRGACNLT
jgi:hypothetical protein